jgi:hypothetical protein
VGETSGEAAAPFNETVTPLQTPRLSEQKIPSSSSPFSIIRPVRLFGTPSEKDEDTSKVLQDGETLPSASSSPLSGRVSVYWPESVTGLQASSSPSSPSRSGGRISWSITTKSIFGASSKKAHCTQKEPAAAKDLAEAKETKQGKQDSEPAPPLLSAVSPPLSAEEEVSAKVSAAFLNLLCSPCVLFQAIHTSSIVNSVIMVPSFLLSGSHCSSEGTEKQMPHV